MRRQQAELLTRRSMTRQCKRVGFCPCPQVERWADAPCQVLLLADAVLWTRCATVALQQLETSNSYTRALRSLADAAVLRLETVSAALRGQRAGRFAGAGGSCTEKGSSWRGDAAAEPDATHPGSRRQTAGEQRHGHGVQVLVNDTGRTPTGAQVEDDSVPVPGAAAAPAAPAGRPATPDTPAVLPMQQSRPDKPPPAAAAAGTARAPCSQGCLQRDTCSHPSISAAGSDPATSSRPGQLSPQQVLGLQALVAAAACHRDVAFALIAAGAEATTSFVWGRQVRHYWQPEKRELKVRCPPPRSSSCWHVSTQLCGVQSSAMADWLQLHILNRQVHCTGKTSHPIVPCWLCRCALGHVKCHTAGSTAQQQRPASGRPSQRSLYPAQPC